jgi:hypothetical protein
MSTAMTDAGRMSVGELVLQPEIVILRSLAGFPPVVNDRLVLQANKPSAPR